MPSFGISSAPTGPRQFTTTTESTGIGQAIPGAPGGNFDPMGLLRWRMEQDDKAKREAEGLRHRAAVASAARGANAKNEMLAQQAAMSQRMQPREANPLELQARNAGLRAQIGQANAARIGAEASSRPMPVKMQFGPGVIPGYAPDTMQLPLGAMPGQAAFQGSPFEDRFRQALAQGAEDENYFARQGQRGVANTRGRY